jgi:hypothetical protein
MSGNAAGRLARTPVWVRYGLIGGFIAFACTLAANLAITLLRPADLCRAGPGSLLLLNLGAVTILLWMAGAAGFITARRVGSVAQATLSGVLVGCLAGLALPALIPFTSAAMHRIQELSVQCPDGGGSFSFGFGTPPPGVVNPTPPPGFSTSPPPGAFGPPTGVFGAVLTAIGMLFTIAFGIGLAAGAAALGGLLGAALRPQARPG